MPLLTTDKWRIHYRPFVLVCLSILVLQCMPLPQAEASFLRRYKSPAAQRRTVAVHPSGEAGLYGRFLAHKLYGKASKVLQALPYGYTGTAVFGIISLSASVLGLLCLALFLLGSGAGAFITVGLIMAVVGVVFGAIGLRKDMNGLAIAGMVLGILEILAAFVGLIVVIVTLTTFAGC